MTGNAEVAVGQIWRNVYDVNVRIDRKGPLYRDGEVADVWWATVCDEQGNTVGIQVPFDVDGFPGSLWTLTGGMS